MSKLIKLDPNNRAQVSEFLQGLDNVHSVLEYSQLITTHDSELGKNQLERTIRYTDLPINVLSEQNYKLDKILSAVYENNELASNELQAYMVGMKKLVESKIYDSEEISTSTDNIRLNIAREFCDHKSIASEAVFEGIFIKEDKGVMSKVLEHIVLEGKSKEANAVWEKELEEVAQDLTTKCKKWMGETDKDTSIKRSVEFKIAPNRYHETMTVALLDMPNKISDSEKEKYKKNFADMIEAVKDEIPEGVELDTYMVKKNIFSIMKSTKTNTNESLNIDDINILTTMVVENIIPEVDVISDYLKESVNSCIMNNIGDIYALENLSYTLNSIKESQLRCIKDDKERVERFNSVFESFEEQLDYVTSITKEYSTMLDDVDRIMISENDTLQQNYAHKLLAVIENGSDEEIQQLTELHKLIEFKLTNCEEAYRPSKALYKVSNFALHTPFNIVVQYESALRTIRKKIANIKTEEDKKEVVEWLEGYIVKVKKVKNAKLNAGNTIPVADRKFKDAYITKSIAKMEKYLGMAKSVAVDDDTEPFVAMIDKDIAEQEKEKEALKEAFIVTEGSKTSNSITKKAREISRNAIKKTETTMKQTSKKAMDVSAAVEKSFKPMEKFVSDTMNKIKKADADERRDIIIRGGFVPKALRMLRRAIAGYITIVFLPTPIGWVGWAGSIIFGVISVLTAIAVDKRMDRREKDKILKELKDELEIVEEKIEDSKGDDNKQNKYQLMRIRNKLKSEINRIQLGLTDDVVGTGDGKNEKN